MNTVPRYLPVVAVDLDGVLRVAEPADPAVVPDGLFSVELTIRREGYPTYAHRKPEWDEHDQWTATHWLSGVGRCGRGTSEVPSSSGATLTGGRGWHLSPARRYWDSLDDDSLDRPDLDLAELADPVNERSDDEARAVPDLIWIIRGDHPEDI